MQFILKKDRKHLFQFTPLQGQTAASLCNTIAFSDNTLILLENYNTKKQKVYYRAQAVFRIFWLLGGFWKLVGWKFILPAWMTNWAYNAFAKRRHQVCKTCPFKSEEFKKNNCFLP